MLVLIKLCFLESLSSETPSTSSDSTSIESLRKYFAEKLGIFSDDSKPAEAIKVIYKKINKMFM